VADNIYDDVRDLQERIGKLESFVWGDEKWAQTGLLTLLRSMQLEQQAQRLKIALLLFSVAILLILCLSLLVLLIPLLRSAA